MKAKQEYPSFDEYWVDFLRKHSAVGTRIAHYLATLIALGPGVYGLVTLHWRLVGASFACTYMLAVLSHGLIEKDRPMAGRPGWGAYSDLKMCWLALTGKLHDERRRLGIVNEEGDSDET